MATLICHNCGHGNTTEATFCAKCASSLRHPQAVRDRRTKAFVPPQYSDEIRIVPTPAKSSSGLGAIVGMMVLIGGLIIWWIIANG